MMLLPKGMSFAISADTHVPGQLSWQAAARRCRGVLEFQGGAGSAASPRASAKRGSASRSTTDRRARSRASSR
eukprot:3562179-Pyramimonas_sp.AAC.1